MMKPMTELLGKSTGFQRQSKEKLPGSSVKKLPGKSTGFQRHSKEKLPGSSMKKLRGKLGSLPMQNKQTKRILQETVAANKQLLKYTNQVDKAITRDLQRNKISPELLIRIEEAKELHKRASDFHPNSDGLVDSYFQLLQHLKDFDSKDEHFNTERHMRHFELSWPTPEITGMSSKNKMVHKMEITANSSKNKKVQRMEDVNKIRQLSDEGTSLELIPMPEESPMLVRISVEGELSQFMDINLELQQGSSSCKRQNPRNGFLCWDFLSGKESYRVHVLEFGRGKSSDGNYSSREPIVSFDVTNPILPEHLFFRNEGDRLTNSPDEDQWRQAGVIVLAGNKFPSLPGKPDSPNLVLLFLQGNRSLRSIPESFFINMPSLRVVDLSDTRIHSLPSSLLGLRKLQVLILRNCSFLYRLPPEIKALENIEVLDLLGAELESVPDELGQLVNLRHLQISFYGADDERECDQLPPILLSPRTISELQHLEALSIVVHPEDLRWVRNAEEIMQQIGNLEHLSYLDFYFPKVEIMEHFTHSPSWKRIGTNKFRFAVGQDVKRIVDRVSGDVERKFKEQDRCLRFVNGKGEKVSEAVKKVLNHVTAFYLDHHSVVSSLSVFGITNCNQLSFCVVRECPNIEAIISEKTDEPAYPLLEYLGLYYLWKLKSIFKGQLPRGSFRALKSLTVDTCPKLGYVFSESLVQCFCNLEELIVEDCESLKEIIEKSGKMGEADFSALPRLKKVKLYYLPQLLRLLWEGETSLEDPLPSRGFQLESVTLYSCPKLNRSLLKPMVEELIEKDYKLDS